MLALFHNIPQHKKPAAMQSIEKPHNRPGHSNPLMKPMRNLKKTMLTGMLGWTVAFTVTATTPTRAEVVPTELRSEYMADPIGIDAMTPRLQWKLEAPRTVRGVLQSAYQILVASSPQLLAEEKGDLWDSGKVEGDQNAHIIYAGKPMESRLACHWKVRVWTGDEASAWSEPAVWEMGLLDPDDWSAKWINGLGYDHLPNDAIQKFPLRIIKAVYRGDGGEKDVTSIVANLVDENGMTVRASNAVMKGDPSPNFVKQLELEYELDGQRLTATVNEDATLSIPEGHTPGPPKGEVAPYLRKEIEVADQEIAKARLYVTCLGLHEMYLNGQRVGDIVFAPEWTDFRKRLHYNSYDVTPLMIKGANVLAGMVGQGYYSGHVGMGPRQFYGKTPALLAQLEITYADGTTETVVTDESWKATGSPIIYSDILMGEIYNAHLEIPGWNQPGLDDKAWSPVALRTDPVTAKLEGKTMDPVRIVQELPTQEVTEPQPGRWTFDLGQNMVGVVRLKVSAPAGTRLTIRHAEAINPDGTIYTTNLRKADATNTYVCKGGGIEIYQPKFTFHGFRYVEVTGLPGTPGNDMITGLVFASDLPRTSEFSSSDDRLNQLYSNIIWGQRGNFLSLPTDCPQRDERCGWGGDAQVFVRTATYNADVAAFYSKWLVDMVDAQRADGAFADISPHVGFNFGTPGWADAAIICPWNIYHVYGDTKILEDNYPHMVKWVELCRTNSTDLIRDKNRGNDYGDWLSINANTPKDLIGTAYFAHSTNLLSKIADVLGQQEDAAKYRTLFEDIREAFNKKYVAADGRIHGNTQTCYLMALKFDLLSDEMRAKAAQYLEEDIKAKGTHLSTGFIGVSYLLPTLTQVGKSDLAYELLLKETFPSWLFSVKHGATTIWERWDGWTPDRGFQDPGMNSFNHFSLGSCGEWMFSTLAGIDTDGPGFKNLIIRPTPGDGLDWVRAGYDSINGRIATSWKTEGTKFTLDVMIPPNTTATVHVPTRNAASVTEGGQPANTVPGLEFLKMEHGAAVYEAGSGSYRFISTR